MDFLKRYPIPIAGLILGLFALGNLVQSYSYSPEARHVFRVIAFVLYVPYLLKVIVLNVKLSEPGVCRNNLVRRASRAYSADSVVHGEICA
ncbi:MAG: hypothetical protein IJS39_05640 [Synergistaceae bacterium]|nr:hypothetical protein [Synergistaceae bacterium]